MDVARDAMRGRVGGACEPCGDSFAMEVTVALCGGDGPRRVDRPDVGPASSEELPYAIRRRRARGRATRRLRRCRIARDSYVQAVKPSSIDGSPMSLDDPCRQGRPAPVIARSSLFSVLAVALLLGGGPVATVRIVDPHKAIVLLSGGIDSFACAHLLLAKGLRVRALYIDFGQDAALHEQFVAKKIAEHLRIDFQQLRISSDVGFGSGELIGRNGFLALTALLFDHGQSGMIGMGLHHGTGYYDCSQSFVDSLTSMIREYTDGKTTFSAPFASWSKRDVYDYFVRARLPIDLTYSCEAGSPEPCGRCASCDDRRELGC
jgi:7-cyano-7-deazaguanine synthase